MGRMGIDEKKIKLGQLIYKNTKFEIEREGHTSDWQQQTTGARQGCPLLPYLFLIIMTTLFDGTHRELDNILLPKRVPGAELDEVTYADDTICVTTDTKAMNKFIKRIEEQGSRYGMKLNKGQCELISSNPTAYIHFSNNEHQNSNKNSIHRMRIRTQINMQRGTKQKNCQHNGDNEQIRPIMVTQ